MPKYRKLHVKTVESLDINDMPDDFTRLLWLQLPLVLCREGRGIYNSRWVQSKIFPLRTDVTMEMIDTAFEWFIRRDMIRAYSVDGRDYFHVPTFHKYQGNTRKEAASEYPAPPGEFSPELVQSEFGASPEQVKSKPPQIHTASASASEYCILNTEQELVSIKAFLTMRAGAVNPLEAEQLIGLVDELEEYRQNLPRGSPGAGLTGDQWVEEAIKEGVASAGKSFGLKYLIAILDRWRAEGYKAPRGGKEKEFQEIETWQ